MRQTLFDQDDAEGLNRGGQHPSQRARTTPHSNRRGLIPVIAQPQFGLRGIKRQRHEGKTAGIQHLFHLIAQAALLVGAGGPLRIPSRRRGGAAGAHLERRDRGNLDRRQRLVGVQLVLQVHPDLGPIEIIGPQPQPVGILVFGAEVELRFTGKDLAQAVFGLIGVGTVFRLEGPTVIHRPLYPGEGRSRPAKPLIKRRFAPRAAPDKGATVATKGRTDAAVAAQTPPAQTAGHLDAAGQQRVVESLGRDDIFARVDPSACEILQTYGDRRPESVFLFQHIAQVKASVAIGIEIAGNDIGPIPNSNVAKAGRQARCRLKGQGGARHACKVRNPDGKLPIRQCMGGWHIDQPRRAVKVERRALGGIKDVVSRISQRNTGQRHPRQEHRHQRPTVQPTHS